jgi:hypothetical protein
MEFISNSAYIFRIESKFIITTLQWLDNVQCEHSLE